MKELKIMITLDKVKLISVNQLYRAGIIMRGGKQVPYIYKNAEAKRTENIITEQLRAIDFSEHLDWLKETKLFTVTNQYILKTGISRRDVSNFTKSADDTLVRFIKNELGISHFDDSEFTDEHLYKSIIPGSAHEYLCISIKPSNFNMRFDQVLKPQQILIHPSSQDYEESKEFKKKLKKDLGLAYQIEGKAKKIKDHDTDIFFINTNNKSGIDIISDIMDYLYSGHKDGGFTYYGFLGSNTNMIQELVNKINSFGLSNIKAGVVENNKPEELIEKLVRA